MGIIQVQRPKQRKKVDAVPKRARTTQREQMQRISDWRKLKTIWEKVDEDNTYYGFAMCTVIFRNHPKYTRYFENEALPEFVQEAKIKKKFTLVCDTLCTLFVDYYNKPSKRDYLIGFIAMVHKDMGLTLEDVSVFLSDLLEALVIELPDIMTEEYVAAQKKYFDQLSVRIAMFMDQLNRQQVRLLRPGVSTKCLLWRVDPEMQMMYGYPMKYWLHKRRYWEYRRAIWASLEADLTDTGSGNADSRSRRRRAKESPRANGVEHGSDTNEQITELKAETKTPTAFWNKVKSSGMMKQSKEEFQRKHAGRDKLSVDPALKQRGSKQEGAVNADVYAKMLMERSRERRATIMRAEDSKRYRGKDTVEMELKKSIEKELKKSLEKELKKYGEKKLDGEKELKKYGDKKSEGRVERELKRYGEKKLDGPVERELRKYGEKKSDRPVEKESKKEGETKLEKEGLRKAGTGIRFDVEKVEEPGGRPRRKIERFMDRPETVDGIEPRLIKKTLIGKPRTEEDEFGKRLTAKRPMIKPQGGMDLDDEIGARLIKKTLISKPEAIDDTDEEELGKRLMTKKPASKSQPAGGYDEGIGARLIQKTMISKPQTVDETDEEELARRLMIKKSMQKLGATEMTDEEETGIPLMIRRQMIKSQWVGPNHDEEIGARLIKKTMNRPHMVDDDGRAVIPLIVKKTMIKPLSVDMTDEENNAIPMMIKEARDQPQAGEDEAGKRLVKKATNKQASIGGNGKEESERQAEKRDADDDKEVSKGPAKAAEAGQDKPQIGTEWQTNEAARARKRKRTTYLGHTQPYDLSLLYDDPPDTESLDSAL